MKKIIGIVGGMGPMATVELFRLIVDHTDSREDQGHIRILIDNNPAIPDRTRAILEGGPSPLGPVLQSASGLVRQGADMILIPCNAMHYYIEEIQAALPVRVIDMVEETAQAVGQMGYHRVGLLATTGTVAGRVYQRRFEKRGIEILAPDAAGQEIVMRFIYDGVKATDYGFDTAPFMRVARGLLERGAQTLVLGCTEVPVGIRAYGLDLDYVNSMEILARAAVARAGYRVR